MPKTPFIICESSFNELCKYISYQIQPSGSQKLDSDTLKFAVYWQICVLFEYNVELLDEANPQLINYTQLLQNIINQQVDTFDVAEIVEQNLRELLQKRYLYSENPHQSSKQNSKIPFLTLAST